MIARGRLAPPGRQRAIQTVPSASETASAPPSLFLLRWRDILDFVKRQPASFKLVCFYLFMEYVRPQQIWEAIAGPPYSKFIIGLAGFAFIMEGRPLRMKMPEFFLGVFTVILLASSFLAIWPDAAYAEMSIFLSWIIIYFLIANAVETEDRFLVFTLSFILYSFKMAQFGTRSWADAGFHFRDWGINGAPGWFSNSGEFGIQMCVFLPIVVYFTKSLSQHWPRWKRYVFWTMPVCAILSIIGSSSRGALVGLAAVTLWMLAKSRYKFRGLVGSAVLAVGVYFVLPPEQIDRLRNMGDDGTSISRTTLWAHGRLMMSDYPVLGIGYGNWLPYHEAHYGLRLLSHNIFIQAGAELGYTGLFAFVALIIANFVINYRTRQLVKDLPNGRFMFDMSHAFDAALIGFLACGFFVTVLYYPFFWINFAMSVALHNSAVNAAGSDAPALRGLRRGIKPKSQLPSGARQGVPLPARRVI
jgi:O-antigen ligase